jgi:lipoprotein-anchoring transpeptidase ErfK/SrfK
MNVNGVATVLSVLGEQLDSRCRPAWLHVELPIRPNGATGWVRASLVDRAVVHARIVVDLSEHRLWLYRHGRVAFTSPVAVGTSATPTPVGRYYVSQRLIPADPNGPWGPYALGTSAYSPVLRGWTQGGPIGIHGTNEPWSIGHDASNGCIRLPNAAVTTLFRMTLAGTPIFIRR